MNSPISVSLGHGADEQGNILFILKIQKDDWEINVWMTEGELALIPNVSTAHWDERSSIQLGKCAGSPTFWSCEDGSFSILVGTDDETWDIGVTLPEGIINDIIAEIERETKTRKQIDV